MYVYGTQYWIIAPTFLLVMLSSSYLYLPVFYELQVTSAYEVGFAFFAFFTTILTANTYLSDLILKRTIRCSVLFVVCHQKVLVFS